MLSHLVQTRSRTRSFRAILLVAGLLLLLLFVPLPSLPQVVPVPLAAQTTPPSSLSERESIDPEGAIISYLTSSKRWSLDGAFTGEPDTYSVPSDNFQAAVSLRLLNAWHYISQEQVESFLEYVKSTYLEDLGVFAVVPNDSWYSTGTVLDGVGSLWGAGLLDVEWFDKDKLVSWLQGIQDLNTSSPGYGLFTSGDDDNLGSIYSTVMVLTMSQMLELNLSATFDFEALKVGLNNSVYEEINDWIANGRETPFGLSLTTTSLYLANLTSLLTPEQREVFLAFLQESLIDGGLFPNYEGPPYPHQYDETIADMPGQYYGLRVIRDLDAWDRFNLTPVVEFVWSAQDLETMDEVYWGGFSFYPKGSTYDMSDVLGRRDMATYPSLGNTYLAVLCLDMLGELQRSGLRSPFPGPTNTSSTVGSGLSQVSFSPASLVGGLAIVGVVVLLVRKPSCLACSRKNRT